MRTLAPATMLLIGAPLGALARPGDGWHEGYGHMMWGGGYGVFGGLMMLVFWGVLIALIVVAVKWLLDSQGGRRGRRDALDILRERYASGEIDEEEFDRRRKALES